MGAAPPTAEEIRSAVSGASPALEAFPPQRKNWRALARVSLVIPPILALTPAAAVVVTAKERFDRELEPMSARRAAGRAVEACS